MEKRCQSPPTVTVVPVRGKDNRKTLSIRTCLLRGNKTTTPDPVLHRKLIFKLMILLTSVLKCQPVYRWERQEPEPGQTHKALAPHFCVSQLNLAQCVCVSRAFNLRLNLEFLISRIRSLCLLPSPCKHRHPARIKRIRREDSQPFMALCCQCPGSLQASFSSVFTHPKNADTLPQDSSFISFSVPNYFSEDRQNRVFFPLRTLMHLERAQPVCLRRGSLNSVRNA